MVWKFHAMESHKVKIINTTMQENVKKIDKGDGLPIDCRGERAKLFISTVELFPRSEPTFLKST